MLYSVYSVHDVNVGFGYPLIQDNDAVAMRSFENGCYDKSSIWYTHSSDFSLWCIGSFDTDSGELISEIPRKVCTASDIIIHVDNVKE